MNTSHNGSWSALIAVGDPGVRRVLSDTVRHVLGSVRVESQTRPLEALASISTGDVRVAFIDVEDSIGPYLSLLSGHRETGTAIPVIFMCRKAPNPELLAGLEPVHVLLKPFGLEECRGALSRVMPATDCGAATKKKHSLRRKRSSSMVVGKSEPFRKVVGLARRVALTECTVLITGPSGTGKLELAKYIHALSARSRGPFVKVSCAAFPDTLFESEIFGHEKDAFTGARSTKPGRFELAAGGTLLLDDIQNLSWGAQAKLLRILQDGTFEHVGGTETLQADVHLIAATNRDLAEMVNEGSFRNDLYWRLNVFPIEIPQLSERRADIPDLVDAFVAKFAREEGRGPLRVPDELLRAFVESPWPGNVRELENMVRRLVILASDDELELVHFRSDPVSDSSKKVKRVASKSPKKRQANTVTRRMLKNALAKCGGNRTEAARRLGITRRQLHRLLEDHAFQG